MITIDLDSYESTGWFTGAAAWIQETDQLILTPYVDSLYRCPFFSLEELEQQAEEILATGLPY